MKKSRTILAMTSAALAFAGFGAHAQITPKCKALVQIQNDLWLYTSDGTPISQITVDRAPKYAAAVSPDGRLVAYTSENSLQKPTIVDSAGRFVSMVNVESVDAIEGLDWVRGNVLRLQEHVSPTSSTFHFYRTPRKNTAEGIVKLGTGSGLSCGSSASGKTVACQQGDSVAINTKDRYALPSPFGVTEKLQTLELAVGRSTVTATSPAIRVDVISSAQRSVTLKLTMPEGDFQTKSVSFGKFGSLVVPGLNGGATLFGFSPVSFNKKTGGYTIDVVKSKIGVASFEGGIVGDQRGRYFAFVTAYQDGHRQLVVLAKQNANDTEDPNDKSGWVTVLDQDVGINGQVDAIDFKTDTVLRLRGQQFNTEVELNKTPGAFSVVRTTLADPWPRELRLKTPVNGLPTAPVMGWGCPVEEEPNT